MFSRAIVVGFVIVVCVVGCQGSTRITYPGCDRAGWKCVKIQATPVKYRIEYICQNNDGVNFPLWNFNAPADIKELKVYNCTAVEIDLTCTNVGRQIEALHIRNVGVLNFTNILYKDMAQLPERVLFEDIRHMPLIPEKTFKQMKAISASSYRCAVNTQPLNTLTLRNVNIGTIQKDAFYNLTDMQQFIWTKVKVDVMEPLAIQVAMKPDKFMSVSSSIFNIMDYKALHLRGPNILFDRNTFKELPRNVIDVISFQFSFINNTVEKIHSFAFIVLSQNVTLENNTITSLKTSALQGIGPGLLENAFMSFGKLNFIYKFINNTIKHSDIGGLNPDWIAYKNVMSYIYVTSNRLPCLCKELGWITLRGGLGKEFSAMMTFNSKFLDKNNVNVCLDTPCTLPLTVMAAMHIRFGVCPVQKNLTYWCQKYNPKNLKDYGFGKSFQVVLDKWQNDFPTQTKPEDELMLEENTDDLDNILELSLKNEDVLSDAISALDKSLKHAYFEIQKSKFLQQPDSLIEVDDELENDTNSSIIFYDRNGTAFENGTDLQYDMDVRNGLKLEAALEGSKNYDTLKKDYEDGKKNFVRNMYEQWQNNRKKRMIYFKLYGQVVTV